MVRHNLSVDDGHVKGELIALVGPVRGVTIEENILYAHEKVERFVEVFSEDGKNQAKDVVLRNNTFVAGRRDVGFHLCNGLNFVFQNNLHWGGGKVPGPVPGAAPGRTFRTNRPEWWLDRCEATTVREP